MPATTDPNVAFQAGMMTAVVLSELRRVREMAGRFNSEDDIDERMFARTFMHSLRPEVAELMVENSYGRLPKLVVEEWEQVKKFEAAKA